MNPLSHPCQVSSRFFPAVLAMADAQIYALKVGNVVAGADKKECPPYPFRFAKGSAAARSQVAAPSHLSMTDRHADILHVISASKNSL